MILENLQGTVSVAELALACNLSRGYFIHAFRETTGITRSREKPAQMLVLDGRCRSPCKLEATADCCKMWNSFAMNIAILHQAPRR